MSSVSHDKRNSEIIGPNDSVSSGNFDWVSTSPATSGVSLHVPLSKSHECSTG